MRKLINRVIDRMIAVLLLIMAVLIGMITDIRASWYWIAMILVLAMIHWIWSVRKGEKKERKEQNIEEDNQIPRTTLTEIVLLGEDNTRLASWALYGKNGLVIGRDIGENQVSINLEDTTYASMIDIEHAVLNYSGDDWYIEDISEKNGVSVQKNDGKKYKLAYGKPCRLECGDIIYVALTRLQVL